MAVTLWKVEYHHLAFLEEVTGSQSFMAFSLAASSFCDSLDGIIAIKLVYVTQQKVTETFG
jgi:hypothetical protein